MQLGENELVETLMNLRRADDFKQDGRRAKRVQRTGKARIQLDGVGPITSVRVRNYSSRGICVAHSGKLPVGQQFVLILSRNDQTDMRILCTVVHCRALSGGEIFSVGAEFTLVLVEEKNPKRGPARMMPNVSSKAAEELERIRDSILS